jgi:hypothetical protein
VFAAMTASRRVQLPLALTSSAVADTVIGAACSGADPHDKKTAPTVTSQYATPCRALT